MFQKHNTSHTSTVRNQGSGLRDAWARRLSHTWYSPHESQRFNMTWHKGVERWGQNNISEERGVHLLGTEAKFCYKNDKIGRLKAYFNHKHSKVCRDRQEKLQGWKMKPELIDYNKFIWGVDKANEMVPYYPSWEKPVKWTKGFMFTCPTDGCTKQFQKILCRPK